MKWNRSPSGLARRKRRPRLEWLEPRELLSLTITVNTAADENDQTDSTLSLREAIEISNGQLALSALSMAERALVIVLPGANPPPGAPPVPNTIVFDIPGSGIRTIPITGTPLPKLIRPVTIDGYSQPGSSYSLPSVTEADINNPLIRIDGSSLGPGTPGTGFDGLAIGTSNCEVDGLIVTAFSGFGMAIDGPGSQGNWLFGNFIGTLPDPTFGRNFAVLPGAAGPLSNTGGGLRITASNNRVGGNTPGLPNVFANNGFDPSGNAVGGVGILLDTAGGTGNLIQGNGIFNNAAEGVLVRSSNNTIGESFAGGGNSIGGNGSDGVLITGGPTVQGNGLLGNFVGTAFGTADNQIKRGTMPDPNHGDGVHILASPKNYVGGADPAARNIIGPNDLDGLAIDGDPATGNRVLNNWVGFNIVSGVEYFLPNQNGVSMTAPFNTIGDPLGGAGNVIDNNRLHGIYLSGASAHDDTIASNTIGLNPGGGSAFPNSFDGIRLENAPDNTIGGTTVQARNTISSNNNGVYLLGQGSTGNIIEGNFIGTAIDGVTDLGNAVDGVVLDGAPNNLVGGTAAGAGNVISGNNRGVRVSGLSATRNDIQGNFIGTDLTGKQIIHNEVDGILVTAGASNTLIGGMTPGAGNTIAFNAGAGVNIDDGVANSILDNSIVSNTVLGIYLNPFTNANLSQPFPTLTSASPNGLATNVQGNLTGVSAGSTYILQFFSSAAKDPTGYGQGQTYLASETVTTDSHGGASFVFDLPAAVPSGQFVTATATDAAGNTSAFSNALPGVASTFTVAQPSNPVSESAGSALVTISRNGGTGGSAAVTYTVGGGSAVGGVDYTPVTNTLFFNPGDTSKTIVVPLIDAHKVGGSVNVNITLSSPTNGALLGNPSVATLTILDNDQSTVQFGPSPGTFHGAGVVNFTVLRDSPAGTVTVDYATADGSALAGINYVATSGTLTFVPGQTSLTIPVTILDDYQVHSTPLTFRITLSHASGALLGAANTIVETVITPDIPGSFQFPSYSYVATPGAASAVLTVYRLAGKTGFTTVSFTTTPDNARPGVDYRPVSGTLTFWPGVYTQTITVPLLNNAVPGSDVKFDVNLTTTTGGAVIGKPQFTTVTVRHPTGPLNPPTGLPPTVTAIQPISGPQGTYAVLLTFSKPMDPARVRNTANYAFSLSTSRASNLSVGILSAVYDPASHRVLLYLGATIPAGAFGRLVIDQGVPQGRALADLYGNLLDGTGTGRSPGSPYSGIIR